MNTENKQNTFIIDAYNLIYRMFYAIPEMTDREGRKVNAIYGVAKFLRSLHESGETHHLIVASDGGGVGVRSEIFAEYKGTRDRMPDDLRSQIAGVFELFAALDIPVLVRDRYEADDIIGSLAHQRVMQKTTRDTVEEIFGEASSQKEELQDNSQLIIISSDKDLCQFVMDGRVHIYDAMKQKFMRESDVVEKFGVPARQVRDYLAIVGDTSDNIPGIAGFGPKKAVDLLSRFDTLEGIYDHIDDLTPKLRETLIDQREKAFLSQKLATIITDLDVTVDPDQSSFSTRPFWTPQLVEVFQRYGFKSLLPKDYHEEKPQVETISTHQISTIEELSEMLRQLRGASSLILTTDERSLCLSDATLPHTGSRLNPSPPAPASLCIQNSRASTPFFMDLPEGEGSKIYQVSLILAPDIILDFLDSYEGEIIGYDLKDDLTRIIESRSRLAQGRDERQESLF